MEYVESSPTRESVARGPAMLLESWHGAAASLLRVGVHFAGGLLAEARDAEFRVRAPPRTVSPQGPKQSKTLLKTHQRISEKI